jgi:hypothetical protein
MGHRPEFRFTRANSLREAGCDVRGRMIFLDLRVTGTETCVFASGIGFQGLA